MAKVCFGVGNLEVKNEQTAPRFEVRDSAGAKLGELIVSKGGVRWLPKGHEEDAHYISWKKFDKLMRTQKRK